MKTSGINKDICQALATDTSRGMSLLFDVYYKRLVVWADTFVEDMQMSEDLVQEFFEFLWKEGKIKELKSETLTSFLHVSVKNRCLHYLEKRDVFRNRVNLEGIEQVFEEYNEQHDRILQEALAQLDLLPSRGQAVMKGIFVRGLKQREVADELGISVSTVKSTLTDMLEKLRDALRGRGILELLYCFFMGNTKKMIL